MNIVEREKVVELLFWFVGRKDSEWKQKSCFCEESGFLPGVWLRGAEQRRRGAFVWFF